MTHGSLSTGICGFDIGAEANGIKTIWASEIEPLRRDIIRWKLPHARLYGDMRKIKNPKKVDIISFGFPCQDISNANPKGKGLEGTKSSLFWKGWKIICRVRPRYIILENSPNFLHKGLREVLIEFAKQGYNAEWDVMSCKQFGMPHTRKRLFVIAFDPNQKRCKKNNGVSSRINSKNISEKDAGRFVFQPQSFRGDSWETWHQTISSFHALDDGIPPNILHGLLESVGDTVSPIVTGWIFSQIIKKEKESNTSDQCISQ